MDLLAVAADTADTADTADAVDAVEVVVDSAAVGVGVVLAEIAAVA